MRRTVGLAAIAVLLTACGGNDDAPPPTTESTTTTEATTTTTEATTTTLSPDQADEAAIRELNETYETLYISAANPPNPSDPAIDEYLADPIRQRTIDLLQSDLNNGWIAMKGTMESEILSIDGLGTDEVVALRCVRDSTYQEDAQGNRVWQNEPFNVWEPRNLYMTRDGDQWKVSESLAASGTCSPQDSA